MRTDVIRRGKHTGVPGMLYVAATRVLPTQLACLSVTMIVHLENRAWSVCSLQTLRMLLLLGEQFLRTAVTVRTAVTAVSTYAGRCNAWSSRRVKQ